MILTFPPVFVVFGIFLFSLLKPFSLSFSGSARLFRSFSWRLNGLQCEDKVSFATRSPMRDWTNHYQLQNAIRN